VAHTLRDARDKALSAGFDAMIVDQIMPDGHGLTFAQEMRAQTDAAIIVLTGRNDQTDRVIALELAADDFITKPFHNRELLARLRAVLRRTSGDKMPEASQAQSTIGDLIIDHSMREARDANGETIALTTQEFELLAVFADNRNIVLSREQISDLARWRKSDSQLRMVDGLVRRLRLKLDEARHPQIKTVHGRGYMMTD
jgi:two-component system OmpR family response regulator